MKRPLPVVIVCMDVRERTAVYRLLEQYTHTHCHAKTRAQNVITAGHLFQIFVECIRAAPLYRSYRRVVVVFPRKLSASPTLCFRELSVLCWSGLSSSAATLAADATAADTERSLKSCLVVRCPISECFH